MRPEGSLPCSQESAISPYPEPGDYSPQLPILFPYDPFYYYIHFPLLSRSKEPVQFRRPVWRVITSWLLRSC